MHVNRKKQKKIVGDGSRVLNADTVGAVSIWHVARWAGAAFGRFPLRGNG